MNGRFYRRSAQAFSLPPTTPCRSTAAQKTSRPGEIYKDPIADPGTGILMPVGPRAAIISDPNFGPEFVKADERDVASANTATALPNSQTIFAGMKTLKWVDQVTGELRDPEALLAVHNDLQEQGGWIDDVYWSRRAAGIVGARGGQPRQDDGGTSN